jgi:Fe-Mn family superoxide dismutase
MFRLPPLPYAYDALAPALSKTSVQRHYEDNHAGYIRRTNELTKGTSYASMALLDVALRASPPLRDQAAQAWAHDFWWRSMSPRPQTPPAWLDADAFARQWVGTGKALFGSGWLWLSLDASGSPRIDALPDAKLPQSLGLHPILVMDLWEHAYYCQYGTKRADYLRNTLPLLNWPEAVRHARG